MAATPPVQKRSAMPSSMKPMRSLPALSCRNSRKLRECRPHGSAGRRRTRDATRFSSMPRSLAFDQVSHGGPPRSATTNRLRIASIQKARVFGQVASDVSPGAVDDHIQGNHAKLNSWMISGYLVEEVLEVTEPSAS